MYAVNSIAFHPTSRAFATAGSDGTFNFWDKDAKCRLRAFPNVGQPITSVSFDSTGKVFAYALSYDWSQGYAGKVNAKPPKIMLHEVVEADTKAKPNSKTGR